MPFVNNKGVKIHYELEGQGPPLVIQHGISGTLESWRRYGFTQELGKDYQLILVDARGHGRSDKPHESEAYRADIVAGDYVTILDVLGIQKAHYYGYSMGGMTGFSCIARYALPRFHSLIIGGASPYGLRTEAEKEARMQRIADMQKNGMQAIVNYYEKREGPQSPAWKAFVLANDSLAIVALEKARLTWSGAEDILENIGVPCLIYVGEADPYCASAREGVKHMPNAIFITLTGLTHIQCSSRSDLVLPHVKKFLAEVSRNIKK